MYSPYDPLFVDDPLATYIEDEALARLAVTNDARFASKDGVVKIDQERWLQAQAYERKTWMQVVPHWTDARNYEFAWGFDAYRALPDDLGDVIELGAGPFTNARLILERHDADSITLLDPLLADYITLDTCTYRDGVLVGVPVAVIPSAIEDWEPEEYDTVIMINTLHHCRDAALVLKHVEAAVKPGGWLVIYEPPREIDPARVYDVGHPLSPKAGFMERFLGKFNEVYRNGWYFIGRKHE